MSVAPQPIGPPLGTPQGSVAQFADIQRAINELKANAYNLAPGGTPADRLVANSITAMQIAAGTITATEIATDAITATKIQAGAVTGAGTGGTGEIASATITGFNIEAGTVNADRISAHTIDANQINSAYFNTAGLSAITANMGSLTSGSISLSSGIVNINDTVGIALLQGTSVATEHNISWINGSFVEAAFINSVTSGGESVISLYANSPDNFTNAWLTLSRSNAGGYLSCDTNGFINTLNDSNGGAQFQGGVGFWGHATPGSVPSPPTTLADVIAIIRGCGLSL